LKLHEYQAKELLGRHGARCPRGVVAATPQEAYEFAKQVNAPVVVKAQVHAGGRGKAGGIKLADTPDEAKEHASRILGMRIATKQAPEGLLVEKVLVAQAVDIAEEYYIGVVIDRTTQRNVIMVCAEGGVDIEDVAERSPEKIAKIFVDPARGLGDYEIRRACYAAKLNPKAMRGAASFIKALYKAFIAEDSSMAEINPLVLTPDGAVLAVDAKMSIDDNALYRHPDLAEMAEAGGDLDEVERVAYEKKIAYVHLRGNVGVLGNGAGLVMATMDEVSRAGGKPNNFLDIGGAGKAEQMKESLAVVLLDKEVKGIILNVFGGIVRCDEVAKGVVMAKQELRLEMPIVVRLTGTNEKEGWEILSAVQGLTPAATMQEAAVKVVQLTPA
jgi:succinyl-CoA synthetase beta subunit